MFSYRTYLGTCIFVLEPMRKIACGYIIAGFKLISYLKETMEAKCKDGNFSLFSFHFWMEIQPVRLLIILDGKSFQ